MAATSWNSHLDMLLNEIQNALIQSLSADPTGVAGRIYYNSSDGSLRWYDGSASTWRSVSSGAGYTDEQVRDVVGEMIQAGTGINVDYDDANDTLTISVDGLTAADISDFASVVGSTTVGGDLTGTVSDAQIATGAIVNADINASAAIALSKLATDPLARSNHTGTQTASTISDFDTQVRTSRLDQMAAPTAAVALNSQKITGLANGTESTDAATFGQLEAAIEGRKWKDPVRAATTANITLSGTQTIDSVSVVAGDRVLVKNQSSAGTNGIYVAAAGAWARSADANSAAEVTNATVMVNSGTTNAGTVWTQTATITTIGTTSQTWVQTGSPGSSYTADGTTIELNGNEFRIAATAAGGGLAGGGGSALSVNVDDNSIEINSDALRVKAAGITDAMLANAPIKRHETTWTGAGTSATITHNIGRRYVQVAVYDPSGVLLHGVNTTCSSTTQCSVEVNTAPESDTWTVVVIG